MKAAVLEKLNSPLVVRDDIEIPRLARGQVLVRLAFSGVCHSQLMEARGKRGDDPYLPHLLGHEGSGTVQEVGEGVTKVKPGDRVILGWIKGRGIEAGGCSFRAGGGTVNSGGVSTFSELSVVSENRCVPLPEGVPLDVAVLFGCAIPTGAGIVTNMLQPAPGSTMAIYGLGGIGMSALMATRLCDPKLVIAVDVDPAKLSLALELGATHALRADQLDPVEAIRKLTDSQGVDFGIEASGLSSTIEQAFLSVRKGGGRCVFASHPKAGDRIRLDPYDLISGRRIEGTWGGACDPDRDIPKFAELYLDGKLPLEKLLTRRYRLDQINEALDDLEGHRVGRPLIELGEGKSC